ncbi:MAG: serine hydrolase [Patescibacteria group bacterium]
MLLLLTILLHINQIDYSEAVLYSSDAMQSRIVQMLLTETYDPPFTVRRALPPAQVSELDCPDAAISAHSGVVLDVDSGKILWQKDAEEALPIASLTKLMTALVFLETNPDFSAEITIEASDNVDVPGSKLHVQPGERVTVGDLFYTSLVGSANNATKALARSTGLPEEQFITRMNALARDMGLEHTIFYEVTGLDPQNTSTVLEYSFLANYAFRNETIKRTLATREYTFETIDKKIIHRIKNTNQLLNDGELELIGAKTGYLDEAGYTFVCEASENGHRTIVVLFRSSSSESRFIEAKALLQWSFDNFVWI